LRDTGRYEDAKALYLTAMNVFEESLGEKSLQYVTAIGDLAECTRLAGTQEIAGQYIEKCISLRIESVGEMHALVAEALLFKALILMEFDTKEKFEEANNLLSNDVLPKFEFSYGHNHPYCYFTKANIGLCLNALYIFSITKDRNTSEVITNESLASSSGQHLIESSIDFFETSDQSKFDENHPWLLRLGGGGPYTLSPRSLASINKAILQEKERNIAVKDE
jgi:hypothetical protein